ncbi:FkbM family methyltransferase [Rhodohalobacter sp. SW132]|uniref:FkbM family methyltransferase n=1 Tax=Rhodohalobacter sp. SW132 TaxID=2293433 RepID=UPI000E276705|nr:FkbM family methyltransferase [Rhodohalobacter sp. SW132]REL38643.1 FkbM family methyltransferase [Rhodohalobacter sp. SW132]
MKLQLARAQALLNQEKPNPDEAMKVLQPLVKRKNAPWPVYHYCGIAFLQKKEYQTALGFLNESVEQGADQPETHHSISLCYFNLENFELAEEFEKTALQKKPDFFKGWLHLGSIYRAQAKLDEALKCFQKANQLDPKSASVAYRIAEIYNDQGDIDKALELFDIAIKVDANFHDAHLARAGVLQKVKRFEEAEEHIYTVLNDEPLHLLARVSLAEHYKLIGNYDSAIDLYEKLVKDFPKVGGIRVNYALCLQELGRFDESEKHYMIAFEDQPDSFESLSNYLMGIHYNPERTREEIFEAHTLWDQHFAPKENPERPVPFDMSRDKKLRLGFISGGFRTHPVGWMITKALENLPLDQFEVYCYTANNKYDQITKRIHEVATKWQPVIGYNDEVIARMIREDEIDILVELSGHSADTRLKTVALEPAPIIIKWVGGLFNTTGLKSVDYLLTDHYETPKGEEEFYTEKLVRMPDDYICFMPPEYAPDVKELPAKKNRYITFGCFNNPSKVNNEILEQWADVMNRVPESRLFLKSKQYDTEALRERIIETMKTCGIERERLIFEGASPHDELLDKYNEVDIALDPWPYSGGLTTCEALWMGVPVVTKPGPTFAGRHSTTHLINAGLPDLVVDTWEQYADKIVELTTDLDALTELRNSLREKVENSLLTDGKRFGAHLGKAMRAVWNQWVDGYEQGEENWKDHIDIEPISGEDLNKITEISKGKDNSDDLLKQLDQLEAEIRADSDDSDELQSSLAENGVHRNGSANGHSKVNNLNEEVEKPEEKTSQPEIYKIETKDGVTVCTPPDLKLLTPYVFLEQEQWYETEHDFVREYLKEGMNVVDAGACFGVYALPAAKVVGKTGHVYAFEPGDLSRHYLETSKIENGFQNLTVLGKAISNKPGKRSWIEGETPELNRLYENGENKVSAITLDSWWAFEGEPKIDLVKLDLNGHEAAAIEGAKTVLSENSPVVLLAMGENRKNNSAFVDQFSELGYTLYEYIPGPRLLTPFEAATGLDPYLQNLIALKPETIQELSEKGWIHDESYTPEEPEAGVWKGVISEFPWAKHILADWEKKSLSPQNQTYLSALNYLCAAEKEEVGNKESRSRKGVWLLAAAQQLVQLYNSGENGAEVTFTLTRVLNALGKRGQAVEVMQKLMETTKLGQKNMEVKLPFLPPLLEQDRTEIKTEFKNWLTVRTVEAWISLKDLSTYLSGSQEKKMLELLEGNVEVIELTKRSIAPEKYIESIQGVSEEVIDSNSEPNRFETIGNAKDRSGKLKKILLVLPGIKGGAHGIHVKFAQRLSKSFRDQGFSTDFVCAQEGNYVKELVKASADPTVAIYSGAMGYDLRVQADMNLNGNLYDLLDKKVTGYLGDHPYTQFMWSRLHNAGKNVTLITGCKSIKNEYDLIFKGKNEVKVIDRLPAITNNASLKKVPLTQDREIELLVPLGLHKHVANQTTISKDLSRFGNKAKKVGLDMYESALTDYSGSVFEIFLQKLKEHTGVDYEFQGVQRKEDQAWLSVVSTVDWHIRKERRIRLLNGLKHIDSDKKIVITASAELKKLFPKLKNKNINWIGEVSNDRLDQLYLQSKQVLNSNPTYPDVVHGRVRSAMTSGAAIISDYSSLLDEVFGADKGISFVGIDGEGLANHLQSSTLDIQKIADHGREIIKRDFSVDSYTQRLLTVLDKAR